MLPQFAWLGRTVRIGVSFFSCRECGGVDADRVLGQCQPDFLATGATHGTSGSSEGFRIDGVRCCTMATNDVHERIAAMTLLAAYPTSVNEPETIKAAQPDDGGRAMVNCPVEANRGAAGTYVRSISLFARKFGRS